MSTTDAILTRTQAFCDAYGLRAPILLAPMAGACPPSLSIAVANGGGLGACGALLFGPDQIRDWAAAVRAESNGAFQLNLWVPDPEPIRDTAHEAAVRAFLGQWGPDVPAEAGDADLVDFDAQCNAMLDAGPAIISSIMGLYPAAFVDRMKAQGIKWFATVSTVAEAKAAVDAGADVVVAQGAEAGGHRGAFEADQAQVQAIGLFSLLPAIVDAVDVPVVGTGGIADARTIAAALLLGASAVQIGTGFLRCPEAGLAPAWAEGLAAAQPEDTMLTRAFSGRWGRGLANDYARAAAVPDTPAPAPYPVQRGLTTAMRTEAAKADDITRMQAWAGQSARLAQDAPAAALLTTLWDEAQALLK